MRQILRAVPFVLLLSGVSSAQVPQAVIDPHVVRLKVIDADDVRFSKLPGGAEGLSQNRVTQIVGDAQGFLWFATQHGVDRYDGYHFRIFKHDRARPDSLCGVFVTSLIEDRAGNLWMGCGEGLDRYDPLTETFVHYHLPWGPLPHWLDEVGHIHEDPRGMLWLATGRGLARLDPRSGRAAWFHHDANDPLSLSDDGVKSSGEDREGNLWVATAQGLDEFDPTTGHVTFHVPLHEPHELSFYEDRDGAFWILSASGNGLAALDRRTGRLTRYSFAARDLPGLPLTGTIQMLEDREGNLWVGTLSDGLLLFDRKNERFIRYRHDPSNPDSIPEDRITCLFEDDEGDIWVGLGATQPVFFTPRAHPFETLPFDSGNRANLGEKLVNVIYQDREGALWVGTTGALARCDSTGRHCTHYAIPGHGVASDVLSIVEDRSGALWVGTSGQGLCRFDRRTGRCRMFRHSDDDPSSISNDTVDRLLADREGVLWVATADGLDRFDPLTERFAVYRDRSSPRSGAQLPSIAEARNGDLWLGSLGSGLLRFDRKTGRLAPFTGVGAISSIYVDAVYIDRANRVWAGTFNGLDRIDPSTGRITRYSEANGLASTGISCILGDASGDLWMSTTRGISSFNPRTGLFRNFSIADGVSGDLTAYSACFKRPDGEMYFGGFAGATTFRPEDVSADTYVPPVVLTAFDLFGAPVGIGPDSPLRRAIEFTRDLILAHDQNSFSFQFTALSFHNPGTNRYRYELEGLEHSWQYVGSDQRYATYTTLPAGAYRFRVEGATNRGPWSEPGVAVRILIMPAWWATWWARTLFVLAALLTLLSAYYLRVLELRRQFASALEAREGERNRVARELHDTLLQSFQGVLFQFRAALRLLSKEPDKARDVLAGAVEQAAQAVREGREAVRGLRLSTEQANDLATPLVRLGNELVDRAAGRAAATDGNGPMTVKVEVEGTVRDLHPIIRDEVFRVAAEALRNAVQHSQGTRVEVELWYESREFRLRVRDDGQGIDPPLLGVGGREGHFGLRGMHERAVLAGGKLTIWSARDAGTEVELVIPGPKAYARHVRARARAE